MGARILRSGWLIAILAILFCPAFLPQTEPRLIVTWDPIPIAAGVTAKYRVQTTVGTTLPFATVVECALPPCTVPDIDGVITYKVRVAGVKGNEEEGAYSEPITFLFAAIQPLSPTSLGVSSAPGSPGKVGRKLSWVAATKFRTSAVFPTGAVVEYRIYQAGTSPAVVIATSQTTSFTIQLPKHKSYQFYITTVVNGIESFATPAVRVNT